MKQNRTHNTAPERHPLRERWPLWLVWAAIVAFSAVGLSNYRIDNNIERWTPGLAASGTSGFVLVGFPRDTPAAANWQRDLAADPSVAAVEPILGDGSWDGLLVFAANTANETQLLNAIETTLGPQRDKAALAGPPVFRQALDHWSQQGLSLASTLILLIGSLVMVFTTRRSRAVIESLIAVLSSQIALVGIISLTDTPMDMVLSMTPPLLMGLGFSFAAHRATRVGVNHALLLSMATTSIALGLFVFTDFTPIRAFALWGAIGVVLTWGAVMLLVTPPVIPSKATPKPPANVSPMRRSAAWAIVIPGAAITLAGFAVLPGLTLQENTLDYFPNDAAIVRDYQRIDQELTGTLPFEITIDQLGVDPTDRIQATPGVRRFERVTADPETNQATYLGLASNDAMPQLTTAQSDWHSWAHLHDVTLQWKGVAAQVDHISVAVWRTARWALPTMLLVAGVAAWWVDHRASSFWLSLWINALPVAVLGLWLAISGRPLGLPSLLISALAIGVAVDDTLHLLVARKEFGSMARAVTACRRPCMGSSLAAALCMLTFLLCPFRPTAEFGGLVALTIIAALVGDLALLPAVVRLTAAGESK